MIGSSLARFGIPTLAIVAAIALLEFAGANRILPITVPAPSEAWSHLVRQPEILTRHIGSTIYAAASGYAIAAAISILAAGVAVAYASSYNAIYNFGVGLHAIPLIATTPLLVVWLGTGPSTRVVIAALACYFPMLVSAMQGFRRVDASQSELFHVLAASRIQRLRLLVLPVAAPYLFAGFKIAAPSAILGAIVAEWTGAERGLGVLMIYSLSAFDVPKLWIAVVAACALASTAYGFWAVIEKRAIYWKADDSTQAKD
jgi:NitT/TauT family transport system permease protein